MLSLKQKKIIPQCPFCNKKCRRALGRHIISNHGQEALSQAVLRAKSAGVSDSQIGKLFGINFRQLEKIIIESYGMNVSGFSGVRAIRQWEPKNFREETTTVWSFKQRGGWVTHNGQYRGNWSPYIPRNVILKYSKPGDVVLDYFIGSGTTAVEAKLLGRKCIAIDINPACVALTREHLNFTPPVTLFPSADKIYEPEVMVGDARCLRGINDSSIDLICAHPPYAGIIKYGSGIEGDLSNLTIDEFLIEIGKVAQESHRVLKPGGKCAILIGDTRRQKHILPLGFQTIDVFLKAGFRLKELVIKRQHNCKTTGFWYDKSLKYNFLLLAHEYLPIFEKVAMPLPVMARETGSLVDKVTYTIKKPPVKKFNELETSTVWIFPEKEFEERLNQNVIKRYGDKKRRLTFYLNSLSRTTPDSAPLGRQKAGLLFIKANLPERVESQETVEQYIKSVKEIVQHWLSFNIADGFLIIQTNDVRIKEYLEPMAKDIVTSLLDNQRLWLKEIVIVAGDYQSEASPESGAVELKITHQYLLVYQAR
ncbi:MAG: DNA methyltransferase [candidate division WOR-3 bacterium]